MNKWYKSGNFWCPVVNVIAIAIWIINVLHDVSKHSWLGVVCDGLWIAASLSITVLSVFNTRGRLREGKGW